MAELSAAIVLSALSAEAAPPEVPVQPDADFLEFLGSWTTGHARPQWIDPFKIQDLPNQGVGDAPRNRQDSKDRMNKRQAGDQAPAPPPAPDPSRAGEGSKP